MPPDLTRREFVTTAGALVGLAVHPARTPPRASRPLQSPVPRTDGPVVLFQGDSITDAGRDRNDTNPNHAGALGSGYPLLVAAGALAAHADRGLRFFNRGISGNKVPDLEARWTTDTVALAPAVLSILIGVNDFWHTLRSGYKGTVADYERQYTALLAETRRALPEVRVLVLEPFVLRCGAVDEHWFPEFDERRAAAARVARAAAATFVPLQPVFDRLARDAAPQYWAADGVHPTPAGHAVIAAEWRRAADL